MSGAVFCDHLSVLGESPLYRANERATYWTDLNCGLVHCYAPGVGVLRSWVFDQPAVAVAATSDPERLMVVLGGTLLLWNPLTDERQTLFQPDIGWPRMRFNDAAIDPCGRLWVGTMRNNVGSDGEHLDVSECSGALYRVDAGGATRSNIQRLFCPNGLAFSPEGTRIYWADSGANRIMVADFEAATACISNKRCFNHSFSRGMPDGSAVDVDGCVWNARFAGGCVVRFSPDGRVDRVIDLPVTNPTCCRFGGDEDRTLFVTSAGLMAPDVEHLAGSLFLLDVGVQGARCSFFALPRSAPASSATRGGRTDALAG